MFNFARDAYTVQNLRIKHESLGFYVCKKSSRSLIAFNASSYVNYNAENT